MNYARREKRLLEVRFYDLVDRTLGSYHPEYKDTYYPINYGCIEWGMAIEKEAQENNV
mgnify:CR=1 FL=1